MNYAFINDNKVTKIEEHEDYSLISDAHLYQQVIGFDQFVREPKLGWIYDGQICYPELPDITPRQCRQGLILSGVSLDSIQAALSSLPEPTRSLALTEWEYSISFKRRRPLVLSVALMLGWSEDDLDNLWIFAEKL